MDVSAQYLEGGPHTSHVSPPAARRRLREALDRVPFTKILLGWDLDPRVVEACAEECTRHGSELYLWQPMLTGHGRVLGEPDWRVVDMGGLPIPGLQGKLEFTFLCPNRPALQDSVLQCLSDALQSGCYNGVFLDRIRFPSPTANLSCQFACFCDACRRAAQHSGLDLAAIQPYLSRLLCTVEGCHRAVSTLLCARPLQEPKLPTDLLTSMLAFRERSICHFVGEAAALVHSRGLKVGLDCFSPALSGMVGQDLAGLAKSADWIKVMTYARAFAPASIPYEVVALGRWLMSTVGESERSALDFIANAAGWTLPSSWAAIQHDEVPASVLTQEIERGHLAGVSTLLAGVELVEMPEVAQLSTPQIQDDACAVRAGRPEGVVLCWDLWRIPLERIRLAGTLYSEQA